MKALVILLVFPVLALSVPTAHAGLNEGAVLIVHTMPVTKTTTCDSFAAVQQSPASAQPTSPATDGEFTCIGILAARDQAEPLNVNGIDFGIRYSNANMILWMCCGDAQLATNGTTAPAWPSSGSGNSIIWADARSENVVVIGYFYAYVYGGGTFAVTPHPLFGGPRLLDDEGVFDDVAGSGRAGFGGLSGVNPKLTPVVPATWGRIKSQFGS